MFARLAALALLLAAAPPLAAQHRVEREEVGEYNVWTLDAGGVRVRITDYGARVLSIECPDRDGRFVNVALGHGPELQDWIDAVEGGSNPYFGAVVGRYGNRIAGGEFELDGETLQLATNNGPNHLHGGAAGFDRKKWTGRVRQTAAIPLLTLTYTSPDGEEGYPGELTAVVHYAVDRDSLSVIYQCITTAATPVNLTQHTYFNLKGEGAGDVLGHELTLNARRFTPVDETLIPTGELRPVAGTPFDFTTPKSIGRDVAADDDQIAVGGGYDHNFVLDRGDAGPNDLKLAAHVYEPLTGRILEVTTTEPGVQLYTANGMAGRLTGTSGRPYTKHGAFCLETQRFPDSPNRPAFPSAIVRPGERSYSRTIFRFKTDKNEESK